MGYEALEDALKNYEDYTDLDDLRNEQANLNKKEKMKIRKTQRIISLPI